MIDMGNLNMGALALGGGLAATVGVFWAQAKTVFSYLSSFILVSTSLDYNVSSRLRRYLKASDVWYRLPGGDPAYATSHVADIQNRPVSDNLVPFRIKIVNSNIMVKRWAIIIVGFNNDRATVRYIRGLFNVERLISDVLDWTAYVDNADKKGHTRFSIYNKMGSEKGVWAQDRKAKVEAGESDLAEPTSSHSTLDVDLDQSFKYARDQWSVGEERNPFDNLFYPPEVLEHVDTLRMWLSKGEWYKERGIPWRRGILFKGPPGTGKSSLARAIAESLDLKMYVFHLSTMSDQEFVEAWDSVASRSMVLFEDFDTVFNLRESQTTHGALTFECVLNKLSGVGTKNGLVLIVTTNHPEKIDDALINRPGRIDVVVEVGPMQEQQRVMMAQKMLGDWPDLLTQAVTEGNGMAGAQFEDHCVQLAFKRMAEEEQMGKLPCPASCSASPQHVA